MSPVKLAVNGSLMRGLALNKNLLNVGAQFVREATTSPCYRLWSIAGVHPAMLRDTESGAAISLEVWEMTAEGLLNVLQNEPPGLSVGKIELADGSSILGVLGEPYICEGQPEITAFGGWRAYIESNQAEQ